MSFVTVVPSQGWDDRVTRVECGSSVAAHLVRSERYLVVVDTLIHPSAGRELLEVAREQQGGRQLLVVTTHADWDHYFGNQVFDCPILGTQACVRRVAQDGPGELARKRAEAPELYAEVRLTPPTLAFSQELEIDGGDLLMRLLLTPGHRSDHVALWLPEISLLLPGDLIEAPIPITDDAPDQLLALRRSLESLLALDPGWVLANHARPASGPQLIRENLAYLRELAAAAEQVCSGQAASMEEAFPYRWPEAADFYRDEHRRACANALAAAAQP